MSDHSHPIAVSDRLLAPIENLANLLAALAIFVVGRWVIVSEPGGFHHAHPIAGVEATEQGLVLQLAEDPGYEASPTGGAQSFFPGRRWEGACGIEIATTASWSAAD